MTKDQGKRIETKIVFYIMQMKIEKSILNYMHCGQKW